MRFIDRLIFLLIKYDDNAPWWRRLNTRVNEGAIIGLSLFLWSSVFFFLGMFLLAKTNSDAIPIIWYAFLVMLGVSVVLSFALSIRQNKDKIEDVPISIPDKTLNRFLAVYIIFPFVCIILGLFAALIYILCQTAFSPDLLSLKKQAKAGDRVSQLQLGNRYLKGDGIKQDYKKAFSWFQKSAEQDLAPALFIMGECYFYGVGIEKDQEKAISYYTQAAEHNFRHAEFVLGYIYCKEEFGHLDVRKAIYWLERADKHGVVRAAHQLGVIHYLGELTERNDSLALAWFRKAAYHGEANSQYMLGLAYKGDSPIPRDLNLSAQWIKKAAMQGHPAAMETLANYYQYGIGVEKDYMLAQRWSTDANKKAEMDSRSKIMAIEGVKALASGQAILLTYPKANNIKEEAFALYKEGFGLLFGIEIEPNFPKAIDKLTEAAVKGSPNAKVLLAYCYASGYGVHLDAEVALHLYIGKIQIKYDIGNESYTIDFELFEDGTFNKTMDLELKKE